jgi:phage shock protein C
MGEAKIAGVCAGFARYFSLDVTLVRVLWVVLTVFPMPFFGLVSYIVAWIVMPKDPVVAMQVHVPSAN